MTRTDIINRLIKKHNFKSYLEIGVEGGYNFNAVECGIKVGVDPNLQFVGWRGTSNDFFAQNKMEYDLIFIDGLHTQEQSGRDMQNATEQRSKNGIIVVHDVNPPSESHQTPEPKPTEWCGEVWKSWCLRRSRPAFDMYVVDCDYGVGVIGGRDNGASSTTLLMEELNYSWFNDHRKEMLNLISTEDFNERTK